jgi:HD superfamily phosphodiesterase
MMQKLSEWGKVFERYLIEHMRGDPAHEINHVKRVVSNAVQLASAEGAGVVRHEV